MLTGRRVFDGPEVTDVLAAVIRDPPPFEALPDDTPQPIRRLLRRCLEKDPRRRLSAIADARLELDEGDEAGPVTGAAPPVSRPRSTGRLVATVAVTVVVTAALTLWFGGSLTPSREPLRRLTVLAPQGQSLYRDSANQAISPDGRRLAFLTGSVTSDVSLWIRTLDDLNAREVQDSEGAQLPFWSPDSATVAFFAGGKLMAVDAGGGAPHVVADAPDGRGGTWNEDGVIVFAASSAGALSRVSSNGGAVTDATALIAENA